MKSSHLIEGQFGKSDQEAADRILALCAERCNNE
jgi:hypothetical protein